MRSCSACSSASSTKSVRADDEDDLFALIKAEHGIPDPKDRKPKPLTADEIPAPVKVTSHVELRAIKNMRHVNAIAENQYLPFGTSGMTVIYGDNGSGKSGYSRVLKRACRARDQTEAIHPNANLPIGKVGTPEAIFEIAVDGVAQDAHWVQGKPAPAALSSFAIFDSRCARAYLDSEDDFSYVPYGLDVFEGLAKVCKLLKACLGEFSLLHQAVEVRAFEAGFLFDVGATEDAMLSGDSDDTRLRRHDGRSLTLDSDYGDVRRIRWNPSA